MNPSWFEHVDLMQVFIGILFTIVVWFFLRTLKKIDANQALLFKRLDTLCEDFYTLSGEHRAIRDMCHSVNNRKAS